MRISFLGTRGYLKIRSDRHNLHSSILVEHEGSRAMVDAGEDWLGKVDDVDPDFIVLTHAHPDHAWGLKKGARCPVYATQETWEMIGSYPITSRHVLTHERRTRVGKLQVTAFPVAHSTRAPTVALRFSAGKTSLCYAPDVVFIENRQAAMTGVALYVGDGASLERSMVRKSGDALIGHASVRTQLSWCQKEGVEHARFTHCGTEIVGGVAAEVEARLASIAEERGVRAALAHDGLTLDLVSQPQVVSE